MNEICRICLETSTKQYPLFGTVPGNIEIHKMLAYLTTSVMRYDENLPNSVCPECFQTVRIAYNLLQTFFKSQSILQNKLKEVVDSDLGDNVIELINIKVINEAEEEEVESVDNEIIVKLDEEVEKKPQKVSPKAIPKGKHNCPICDMSYAKFTALKKHLSSRHTSKNPFDCTNCDFTLYSIEEFIEHYAQLHLYQCDKCNKSFTVKSTFMSHKNYAHSLTAVRYLCKYENCGKSFKYKHSLGRHECQHGSEGKYKCGKCEATFKGYDQLRYHVRTHGVQRPHLCTECGKTFVLISHLKAHMWVHTGIKQYRCNDCGKSYCVSMQMKKHRSKCTGR